MRHEGCLLGGLGIFPPSLQGRITNPPPDQPSHQHSQVNSQHEKGQRWCRSHKSPERGSQLLLVSKLLSQQGPTGCTNSSANWKQQIKQIQANISKTTPYKDTSPSGGSQQCCEQLGRPLRVQHTWKSERQQHCTSSVLSRAGEGRKAQGRKAGCRRKVKTEQLSAKGNDF